MKGSVAATAAATANIKMKTKTNLLPTQVHTELALAQGQVAQSHARHRRRRRRLMDFTRCLATNDGYLWLTQLAASVVWVAHHSNPLQSLALARSLTLTVTLSFPLSLTVSASSAKCQKPNKPTNATQSADLRRVAQHQNNFCIFAVTFKMLLINYLFIFAVNLNFSNIKYSF